MMFSTQVQEEVDDSLRKDHGIGRKFKTKLRTYENFNKLLIPPWKRVNQMEFLRRLSVANIAGAAFGVTRCRSSQRVKP